MGRNPAAASGLTSSEARRKLTEAAAFEDRGYLLRRHEQVVGHLQQSAKSEDHRAESGSDQTGTEPGDSVTSTGAASVPHASQESLKKVVLK